MLIKDYQIIAIFKLQQILGISLLLFLSSWIMSVNESKCQINEIVLQEVVEEFQNQGENDDLKMIEVSENENQVWTCIYEPLIAQ